MKISVRSEILILSLLILMTMVFTANGISQELNLDKMKKLGDLVCYQSLKDPGIWYYLPDQPRLAMKNGKPQFSFMKYSRTSKTGKAGINAAEGGGIVHFLVTYGASKERVKNAQRRLQEQLPEAKIEGPIVYRKGSFALITSFQQGQQSLVKTVAVGKAPLMEGQKAAVSMALSREGAQVLWESFKSDTPDISLVFDMEFAGVREPYEATIEADWTRVSKHKRLKAGMKYSWFGADVDMLFQELRQNGAIKITTKGENASMDKIVESAHAKLLQVMFDPAPVDDLSKAAAEKDSYSNLNQAMKLLKDAKGSGSKSSGVNTPKSFLDLNTPGFRQMITSIIDAMIPSVHAATKLTDEERQNLRALFLRGVELKKAQKYEQALEVFHEVLQQHEMITDDQSASAHTKVNIAFCLDKLGQYYVAADHYEQAADIFGRQTVDGKYCMEQARKIMLKAEAKDTANAAAGDRAKSTNSPNDQVANQTKKQGKDSSADRAASTAQASAQTASEAYSNARRLDEAARKSGYLPIECQDAVDAYEAYLQNYPPKGQRKSEIEGRIRSLKRKIAEAEKSGSSGLPVSDEDVKQIRQDFEKDLAAASKTQESKTEKPLAELKPPPPPPTGKSSSTAKVSPGSSSAKPPAKKSTPSAAAKKAADKVPGFSLVASFQMKNIKRSGKMVYHMNHFRTEKQSFTMTENIGSLYSRYKNDSRVFKAVTIDDPVFKQREILVTLDGQDASTFTKYLNFVTVKMKKRHQSGESTNDEIVITPEAFNTSGNSFSLNYGYKGDTDRDRWLEYQYQVVWSFHGGLEIRSEWKSDDRPMLSLAPPYRYRSLTIEGEGEELRTAKVRHAVITVSSLINGEPIVTQATVKNQGPAPALHLEIPEDATAGSADVSIKWFLKGGKKVQSKTQQLEGDILYWDELPESGGM